MARFARHVFVCTNVRPPGHPKGCCSEKGSVGVRDALKAALHRRGLKGIVRANSAGCLDACAFGVSMVVYPEGIWYGGVTVDDIEEIVEKTILNGQVIERLLIRDPAYAPERMQFPPIALPWKKA